MRRIEVVTVARSDYGIYRPVLARMAQEPSMEVALLVSGMHLSPEFGRTVEAIERDGYRIEARIESLLSSDSPSAIAKSIGIGIIGFADAFSTRRPDILMVLGDRFDMYAAAVAALPFRIPVAHVHGGEVTEGAIDDALRHSITKLSHLHFTATEEYAQRVCQLGEQPWRITVSGAPGLDNVKGIQPWSLEEVRTRFDARIPARFVLVTLHPVTLEADRTEWQAGELLKALEESAMPVVFTLPNADTNGRVIIRMIEEFCGQQAAAWIVPNAGVDGYISLLARATAMVGNSSSGIIEAPSFELPVVNIGTRQNGRTRSANVIDVGYHHAEILEGIRRATSEEFRAGLKGLTNPYGDGNAAVRIVERLKTVVLDERLIRKTFHSPGAAA